PASVYCEQSGGKTEIVKAASGWTGYCNLPGGERVEEWTYYRKNHK
ncbi:TPA: putative hemolysin, partial [Morganella morganii]